MDDVKRKTDVITAHQTTEFGCKLVWILASLILNILSITSILIPSRNIVFTKKDCTFYKNTLAFEGITTPLLKQRKIWYAYLVIIQKWKVGIHMC